MNDHYELLKNRLLNGKPFLKERATKRVDAMLANLEITEEQATELMAIIAEKGVDILPSDAMGRLDRVETQSDENTLMLAELIGGAI